MRTLSAAALLSALLPGSLAAATGLAHGVAPALPAFPWPLAVALGAVVGMFGTLIGAGGGFLLLPVLVLAAPHSPPAVLAAVSLVVVFVNATAGSVAYARMRRIDVRSGLAFALAGIPGSIVGAAATRWLDRRMFDLTLGALLLLAAAVLLMRPAPPPASTVPTRTLTESDGTVHRYRPKLGLGVFVSVAVGFLSSLMGIGGGILHVPLMVFALGFPVHVATATSHFVLACVALAGTATHAADGTLAAGASLALPLAAGALLGAPLGARFSNRIEGPWILRGLAIALTAVALRLLLAR